MNRTFTGLYLSLLLLLISPKVFGQRFSQYNTGTLYDSFENPSQKTFIPDSSRRFAVNLFIPNFSIDATLSGNTQAGLKSRAFLGFYDGDDITIGKKNFNYVNANFNSYWFMLKWYGGLDNNSEWGVFAQSRGEGRGVYTDESVQLLNDNNQFGNSQTGYFNDKYSYQLYHQVGVSYRQDLDDQLSFGIKVSALLGVVNNRVNINRSVITYDRANDQAFLSLAGNYRASYEPGGFTSHDLLPGFRNPGAQLSFGVGYLTEGKIKLQFNLKDLGFIYWSHRSKVGEFDNTGVVTGLSQSGVENRVTTTALSIFQGSSAPKSFVSNTNALLEASAAKTYWIDGIRAKYTPTLIAQKELFYRDATIAMVNHLQMGSYVATLMGSYTDMHYASLGAQFMIKSPNAEFFIGSERLGQTFGLARDAYQPRLDQTFTNNRYSGANFYLGFSLKFGRVIEHPMNASYIPMGPKKSFLWKVWERIINKEY